MSFNKNFNRLEFYAFHFGYRKRLLGEIFFL
jgi:hypothetical protein